MRFGGSVDPGDGVYIERPGVNQTYSPTDFRVQETYVKLLYVGFGIVKVSEEFFFGPEAIELK